jgi:hypothetical protein
MKKGNATSDSRSRHLALAGLLVILILVPEVARAQSGPALAPYPFRAGMAPPPTRVSFLCNVKGATLYVDGVFRGPLPLPYDLQLDVGEHSILIKADGHYNLESTIDVPAVVHKRYRVLMESIYPEVVVKQEKESSNAWVAGLVVGVLLTVGLAIGGIVAAESFFSGPFM